MKTTINLENYFDYAEALYCFASLNHNGQSSELYKILCRSPFNPGPLWTETKCELENSVFHEVTEENCSALFEELEIYLEVACTK